MKEEDLYYFRCATCKKDPLGCEVPAAGFKCYDHVAKSQKIAAKKAWVKMRGFNLKKLLNAK